MEFILMHRVLECWVFDADKQRALEYEITIPPKLDEFSVLNNDYDKSYQTIYSELPKAIRTKLEKG